MLSVGIDPNWKHIVPPGQRRVVSEAHCVADCTQQALPSRGINVFAVNQHTHLLGIIYISSHFFLFLTFQGSNHIRYFIDTIPGYIFIRSLARRDISRLFFLEKEKKIRQNSRARGRLFRSVKYARARVIGSLKSRLSIGRLGF